MGAGHLQRIRRLKSGDQWRIEHVRELIDAIDASSAVGGVGITTRSSPAGTVINAAPGRGGSYVDPTNREFQIKFWDMESNIFYPSHDPKDDKVPVVFSGRIFDKEMVTHWCGPEEEFAPFASNELYVVINVAPNGDILGAAFLPKGGENIEWKPGKIGMYFVKVGHLRDDGSVYQMLQGPIELFLRDEAEVNIHEFKIKIASGDSGGNPDVPPTPPVEEGGNPPAPEGEKKVKVYWGRILKADYSAFDVGEVMAWNSVPDSSAENCKIYVLFDVDTDGVITKAEFATKERENKQFYPPSEADTLGQFGEYCIQVGSVNDGVIVQTLHGPIPFLSRVGRARYGVTAYKGVDGQFLDFWPMWGAPGLEVELNKVTDEETGESAPSGIKFIPRLIADNGGIKINIPSKKSGKEDYVGIESTVVTPFSVTVETVESDSPPPAPPPEEGDGTETPPETEPEPEPVKKIIVKANGGTVSYFRDNSTELSTWYGEDAEFPLEDGYIYVDYGISSGRIEIKYDYSPPQRWESDNKGEPTYSRCAVAKIFGGKVTQLTFCSFIASPMFIGDRAVLDMAPYASIPNPG